MPEQNVLHYVIKNRAELNLSFMPFINEGGLFVPTSQTFSLGDNLVVNLTLPGKQEVLKIEGKVVWITPHNALYQVLTGVGIQFIGENAANVLTEIKNFLDPAIETGGYT